MGSEKLYTRCCCCTQPFLLTTIPPATPFRTRAGERVSRIAMIIIIIICFQLHLDFMVAARSCWNCQIITLLFDVAHRWGTTECYRGYAAVLADWWHHWTQLQVAIVMRDVWARRRSRYMLHVVDYNRTVSWGHHQKNVTPIDASIPKEEELRNFLTLIYYIKYFKR